MNPHLQPEAKCCPVISLNWTSPACKTSQLCQTTCQCHLHVSTLHVKTVMFAKVRILCGGGTLNWNVERDPSRVKVPMIVTSSRMQNLSSAFDHRLLREVWAAVVPPAEFIGWSNPEYWGLSREVIGTILTVFGKTRPEGNSINCLSSRQDYRPI